MQHLINQPLIITPVPRFDSNLIASGGETRINFACRPIGFPQVFRNGTAIGPDKISINGLQGTFTTPLSGGDRIDGAYWTVDSIAPGASTLGGIRVYGSWNPADHGSNSTLSNSNLTCADNAANNSWSSGRSVTSKNAGKWYAELNLDSNGTGNNCTIFGVGTSSATLTDYFTINSNGWGVILRATGAGHPWLEFNNTDTAPSGWTNQSAGAKAKVAIDLDAGKMWFGLVGTGWANSGNPATGANPSYTFTPNTALFLMFGNQNSTQGTLNAGASSFTDTVPTGFNAGWYTDT